MKKLILALYFFTQLVFCFAEKTPTWINNYESEFSKTQYIARLGSGSSVENARADALSQIAGFFKSEVLVNTNASNKMKNDGEKTVKNQEINQNIQVVSDITLTAIEFNTPYYDKKKKTYYIVAYIERKTGWQSIESKILQQKTKFDSFLELSKEADDSILKYKYLTKAKTSGDELISTLYMGFLFDPEKKKEYRNLVSEISQNLDLETLDSYRIPVRVVSTGDYENIITSRIVEVLKNKNFSPYIEQKNNSDSIAKIVINSNEKTSDEIHSISPDVSVTICNADETRTFYTYQNSWGKSSNFSLQQAQKKAFPKIAEDLRDVLSVDFDEKFLNK